MVKLFEIENKKLVKFIKSTKVHIENIDNIIKSKETEKYKLIAKEMNRFNFSYDEFLHFALNIPFEKFKTIDNKTFKLKQEKKQNDKENKNV